jgi:transcriptional regulator with XRE-family HTH domain
MSEKGVIRSVIMAAVRIKGTQSVVADEAGIDGSGLSKFLSGEGSLKMEALENLHDYGFTLNHRAGARRQRSHASDLCSEVVDMTLDDLTLESTPRRRAISSSACSSTGSPSRLWFSKKENNNDKLDKT